MSSEYDLKSKMMKLYYARKELEHALSDFIFSVVISCALAWIIITHDDHDLQYALADNQNFFYILELFIIVCCLDCVWKLLLYGDVLFLRHAHIETSRCLCANPIRSTYLIAAIHTIEPCSYETGRLEFTCRTCNQLIYHCNINQGESCDCKQP